jgi:hypothetical protein
MSTSVEWMTSQVLTKINPRSPMGKQLTEMAKDFGHQRMVQKMREQASDTHRK